MVLTASPVMEYDKRIELLTKERGRLSAFVQGARRLNSPLSACAIPFTFGTYQLYLGRSSNRVKSCQIQTYFEEITQDYDVLCYASYFAELAQYFTRENVEAPDELLLLYITCKSLVRGQLPCRLIRSIYEMRIMQIEGEALELFQCLECGTEPKEARVFFSRGGILCSDCAAGRGYTAREKGRLLSPDALYSLQFILTAPLQKLYSFRVSEEIEQELGSFLREYLSRYLKHEFRSESFLTP